MSEPCHAIIRCPERPTWFLRRFRHRPWVCPRCATAWTTWQHRNIDGVGYWAWKEIGRYVKERDDE